jgi:hypothetical protein
MSRLVGVVARNQMPRIEAWGEASQRRTAPAHRAPGAAPAPHSGTFAAAGEPTFRVALAKVNRIDRPEPMERP